MQRILVCSLLFLFPILIQAKDVPTLSGRVMDETWTLDPGFVSALEKQLKDHESNTSNQIVVLVIPSLEGEDISEYSIKVVEKWKLGQKKKDNGVLLLISLGDRKIRIEVGYGLEGSLTDILCRHIIENEIKPDFKKGDLTSGIQNGVNAIIEAIAGSYTTPKTEDYSHLGPLSFLGEIGAGQDEIPYQVRIFISVFVLIILGIFTYVAANAPYIGWFIYFFLFPFWSIFPTAIHGANIGAAVFLAYAIGVGLYKLYHLLTPHGRKRMKKGIFGGSYRSSGSSGGWSSSSSGGSSRSSGFSGGGGSFGGGGSSGSW
ncbi:TPM domain-containing protein [Leptospira sp. 201903074]|uniref:TPM domain-containing protein n=1 Tax=Leptospira abararensis TaxID=2810036 RepID=UPI00196502D4|nr:TPM domain-containing protein [Leptospira abararensis]MBM9548621.1 TPM domain-containing protein [Leptospira abararensis]